MILYTENMKCFFRSFDVGIGDCIVIRLVKDDGKQYVIMVDCGKYTTPLKKYLQDTLQNHIDLLIATHIDGDHIQGMVTMLKENKGLTIKKIWYNCYRRKNTVGTVELNEQQKAIIKEIQKALPVEIDAINYREISASQGKTLARTILENEKLKKVWEIECITCEMKDFDLPEGFGKIVILAPKQEALKAIDNKFRDTFDKYFMQVWNENIESGEELQELLIRMIDAYQDKFGEKLISARINPVYDAAYVREQAKEETIDDSDTNYSSIAFILECGEHKIAMLGDAFANTLEECIDYKYKNKPKPLLCDAIKVSHHGSNANNSKALFECINSHLYFISGGKGERYPTWGTFGRIAETYKDEQIKQIVFSHRCDITEKINGLSNEDKRELGVETIISDQEYELFEW